MCRFWKFPSGLPALFQLCFSSREFSFLFCFFDEEYTSAPQVSVVQELQKQFVVLLWCIRSSMYHRCAHRKTKTQPFGVRSAGRRSEFCEEEERRGCIYLAERFFFPLLLLLLVLSFFHPIMFMHQVLRSMSFSVDHSLFIFIFVDAFLRYGHVRTALWSGPMILYVL